MYVRVCIWAGGEEGFEGARLRRRTVASLYGRWPYAGRGQFPRWERAKRTSRAPAPTHSSTTLEPDPRVGMQAAGPGTTPARETPGCATRRPPLAHLHPLNPRLPQRHGLRRHQPLAQLDASASARLSARLSAAARLPDLLGHLLQQRPVTVLDQRHGHARRPRACRSTDAVEVSLQFGRSVVVDNHLRGVRKGCRKRAGVAYRMWVVFEDLGAHAVCVCVCEVCVGRGWVSRDVAETKHETTEARRKQSRRGRDAARACAHSQMLLARAPPPKGDCDRVSSL
jgi:hypothetical protein